METLEAILTRRSIRHYTAEPVSPETIKRLLEAGMSAPSSCDFQPWQLVVITERRLLDGIPGFHNHAAMLPEAPLAILVCGSRMFPFCKQDCAAASPEHIAGRPRPWHGGSVAGDVSATNIASPHE